jgi:hypothetical protein
VASGMECYSSSYTAVYCRGFEAASNALTGTIPESLGSLPALE